MTNDIVLGQDLIMTEPTIRMEIRSFDTDPPLHVSVGAKENPSNQAVTLSVDELARALPRSIVCEIYEHQRWINDE